VAHTFPHRRGLGSLALLPLNMNRFPTTDGFVPDFYNGAEVARRAEEYSRGLGREQRRRNKERARRPQVARELSEDEAARFRYSGQQITLPNWN